MNQKPGDIVVLAASSGFFHLVRVDDIMTKIKAKSMQRGRLPGNGNSIPTLAEQLSGERGKQPTYFLETFGCQMNLADTERFKCVAMQTSVTTIYIITTA